MEEYDLEHPQSRGEQYLGTLTGDYSGDIPAEPHSRVEAYLDKLVDVTEGTNDRIEALETGKADLEDGKVPERQLPSYVDDVVEYESLSAFPETGESGKIYVAKDTNSTYRWSGTEYIKISDRINVDNNPTQGSTNAVSSGGVFTALSNKQDTLTIDATPTDGSNNPVASNGVYDALAPLKALGFSLDAEGNLVQEADE